MTDGQMPEPAQCSPTSHERRVWGLLKAWGWWAAAFMLLSLGGMTAAALLGDVFTGSWAIGFSLLPIIPGFFAVKGFLKFYREADELTRGFFAEGMVCGFGALVVFWGITWLPEQVWLPKLPMAAGVCVMMTGFCIGIIRAERKRT